MSVKTNEYHCHGSDEDKYNRGLFGNWTDEDNDCQDTRQEVLIQESLVEVTFRTNLNCKVIEGLWLRSLQWIDLYEIQDYLMWIMLFSLKEAFDSGANHWSREKRTQYFNDLTKGHLVVVHKSINRSKGSKGT